VKFAAANLTHLDSETVTPSRIAECPLQLEATIAAVHPPAGPDEEHFQIFEAHVQRIHAAEEIIKPGSEHIDPTQWSPLLYVFRHYFGTGDELGRTYRAED
jgi:flavin reductase (DIM6/NTAB) family NADH-FMN oxidoreductase RutF